MKTSRMTKLLSVLLSAVLMISLLPAQALATEEVGAQADDEAAPKEPMVTEEVSTGRDRYQKEFLLDNGAHLAMVFPVAVHYRDDGEWAEIDNTLIASRDGRSYTNKAGEWDVSLPATLDAEHGVTVQMDEAELSFSFAGELTTEERPDATPVDMGGRDGAIYAVPVQTAQAHVEEIKPNRQYKDARAEVLTKNQSAVTYRDVFADTALRYDLISSRLKESVTISRQRDELVGYQYMLQTGTLNPVLQKDGSVEFYSPEAVEGDEAVFVMPAPYLYDAEYAFCDEVDIRL